MITEECIVTILRFYTDKTQTEVDNHAPYSGVCQLIYLTPAMVMVKGLKADLPRAAQRQLLDFFVRKKIEVVKADREPGRTLPLARRVDDLSEMRVEDLVNRFKSMKPKANPEGHKRRANDFEDTAQLDPGRSRI